MARARKGSKKAGGRAKGAGDTVGFERTLWEAADKLRNNMDAAEYKHVVLGLIFLKYISDAFEEKHAALLAEQAAGADPEDPDEYRADNIFWVPKEARWTHLQGQAKQPTIGKLVDDAMVAIERDNPSLKGVLPKDYARPALDKQRLAEVQDLPQKNLAVELLRRLLNDEVKLRSRHNVVQARSFAELLEKSIRRYQNRAIEAASVIEELIELARQMREAAQRGEKLGLTNDELAFYDALEVNDSAVQILGDECLRAIAQELVRSVRNNVTIDWSVRETVRARLRVLVKRILRRHGYPPDKQATATKTVLEQAEVLSEGWVTAA